MNELRGAAARLISATVASERPYGLAECPLWDEQRERVLCVDINAGHIHSGSLEGDIITPGGQLQLRRDGRGGGLRSRPAPRVFRARSTSTRRDRSIRVRSSPRRSASSTSETYWPDGAPATQAKDRRSTSILAADRQA
jgi:sugar lactone lactonase YvrE